MFWYPEKPNHIFDTSIIPENYIAQIKKDGWRIIITNINGKLELFNREGKLISAAQDKEWMWINKIFPGKFYLDGELIGQRQKNVLTNTIAIWDALYLNDKFLINSPYIERYNLLMEYADVNNPSMDFNNQKTLGCYPINVTKENSLWLSMNIENHKEVWKKLDAFYLERGFFNEGMVYKNPDSKLSWNVSATKTTSSQLKMRIEDHK